MQLGDGDCVSFTPEENNNDDCSHLVDIDVSYSELDPVLKIITFHLFTTWGKRTVKPYFTEEENGLRD